MDGKQAGIRLLQEIVHGSQSAFDTFYETYVSFVYQIAYRVVGDRLEAEDVCHDVFLEVYQKPSQYRVDKGSVKAWLAVKTKSRALDHLRKKKPVLINKLEKLLLAEDKGAELYVLSHIEREIVLEALQHIPENQRQVIYGSYFQQLTHRQLATSMNKPLGSIKSLIRYGLNNLRKQKALLNWSQSGGGEK